MLDNNTSSDSKGGFASHENTIESLKYAEEDLNEVNKKLNDANRKIPILEAENRKLTNQLKAK